MKKVDPRKDLKHLYHPSANEVSIVDVPEMAFLSVDGQGEPNTSEWYGQAVEALYAVSYARKFMVKKGEVGVDYAVVPLEGLWWADDMSQFSTANKDAWKWTMMIAQPEEYVTGGLFEEARQSTAKKKASPHSRALGSRTYRRAGRRRSCTSAPTPKKAPTSKRSTAS